MAREYRLSIIVSGQDTGAKSMLGGIGSALGSIGTIAGGILGAGFFLGIANQVKEFAKQAISATAQVERMEMMLTSLQARELIKSGDFTDMNDALAAAAPLAKATMDQLERIAIISPYQLENVSNTFRMAQAFGYTAQEATVFTKALLDIGAGVGADNGMLDRMAYNLAQVRMVGKVTALDIRQLAMAGLDLNDMLRFVGDQMGVNIETHEDFNKAIEDGSITWEDFTTNFGKYADQNFGGAAERMSRTMYGLWSSFKDIFALSMPAILGPAFERIGGLLGGLMDNFLNLRDSGALEVLGTNFANSLEPGIAALETFLVKVGLLKSDFADERGWDMPVQSIDLMDMFVDATETFKTWTESIDWQVVSDGIVAGIDQIDWTTIGEKINTGFTNIFSGLETLATFDFTEVANAATEGFADTIIAALGGETTWAGVEAQWASNFDQLSIITSNKLVQIGFIGQALAGVAGTTIVGQVALSLINGGISIFNSIMTWIPQLDSAFQTIKTKFYTTFQQSVLQAVRALEAMTGTMMTAISTFITKALSVLKPIFIKIGVDLPNFADLAKKLQDGMDWLNDIKNGKGNKGGKSTDPGNGGGSSGGSGSGNGVPQLASGGIASGPRSGFPAILHGTEAVIPLNGGSVPVSLNPSGMGSGGGIFFTFVYSPVVSTASEYEAGSVIGPIVADVVRNEFAKRNM